MTDFANKRSKAKFKNSVPILIHRCFEIAALIFSLQATMRKHGVEPQINNSIAWHFKIQPMCFTTYHSTDVLFVIFSR